MNDELKEILEDLKNKDLSVDDLTHNDKTKLLDYITNLQEENETLNSRINKAIEYIKSIKYMNCRYFDYNKWRKNTPYGSIEELHEKIKKDGTLEGHFVEVNRDIIFNILNGGDEE